MNGTDSTIHPSTKENHNVRFKIRYTSTAVSAADGDESISIHAGCNKQVSARLEKVRYNRSKSCVEQQAHQKLARVSNPGRSLSSQVGVNRNAMSVDARNIQAYGV
jgi:uncharacterized protein YajQ (UPF0234 family)